VHVHLQRVRAPLLGHVRIAATAHGVVALRLDDDEAALCADVLRRFPDAAFKRSNGVTTDAARQICRYLGGGPDPHVAVVVPEQGFSARVWREIARIPRGTVRSYSRVARAMRLPQAARAVGQACRRNPVPLIVPCHRVVAADGSLGGFTGGLETKRRLLAMEGASVKG
jgi:AraC family transcriptional regulator of adaptative response/methylated-DNA-[protein]-cysteine methyltransferase